MFPICILMKSLESKQIKVETEKDDKQFIREGWPKNKYDIPNKIYEYWNCKYEPTESKGFVLKGVHSSEINQFRLCAREVRVCWTGSLALFVSNFCSLNIFHILKSCQKSVHLNLAGQYMKSLANFLVFSIPR
jgi:hypothetical protein